MFDEEVLQRFQLPDFDALVRFFSPYHSTRFSDSFFGATTTSQPHFPTLHTPYFKYCNTNHIASDSEFGEVRKIASELQAQLNDLDIILERIGKIQSQLNERRTRIVSSLRLHQGLTSSIRRLPSEILKEIFVQCLPPPVTDPDEDPLEPDTSKAPLLLTGVCRRWREIALDTPSLWCSLAIFPMCWSRDPQQKDLVGYRKWLSRSKNRPLSLDLTMYTREGQITWTDELINILQLHRHRFRRLHYTINDAARLNGLLKDIPILEDLDICSHGEICVEEISIVQPQPRLRVLAIDGFHYGPNTLSPLGGSI